MKNVLLLLIDGFETYEASVFIDIIGWNLIDGNKQTKLYTCGIHKEIKTAFDQKMIVDYLIDEINPDHFDALAIPGGFEEYNFYKEGYNDNIFNLIREFDKRKKIIAAVCVASIIVAKSGVLNNRKATTYHKKPIRQETLRNFGTVVKNEPLVVDENIITCWNPATALDVAFLLLERLTDIKNCHSIKEIMGF